MYDIPKNDELLFLNNSQLTQICIGKFDIKLNFYEEKSKVSNISINIDISAFFHDEKNKEIILITLINQIGNNLSKYEVFNNKLRLFFNDVFFDILTQNNVYETMTINHDKDIFVI